MSVYGYCHTCGDRLDRPTLREVILGVQHCPAYHRNTIDLDREELANLLCDLEERVTALEMKE